MVKRFGVEQSRVDLGLLLKQRDNKSPELFIAQYIDDSLTIGKLKDVIWQVLHHLLHIQHISSLGMCRNRSISLLIIIFKYLIDSKILQRYYS